MTISDDLNRLIPVRNYLGRVFLGTFTLKFGFILIEYLLQPRFAHVVFDQCNY